MKLFPTKRRSFFSGRTPVLDRRIVWWIALACGLFGVLSLLGLVIVPQLTGYACWIVLGGLILLLIASR